MSERSASPASVSASEFVATLTQNAGDLAALHQQHPGLAKQFIGEGTNPDDVPPGSDIIPHGVGGWIGGCVFAPGDTVRVNGFFSVEEQEEGPVLCFRAATVGDVFSLGALDPPTADTFTAYGPTYTQVDIAVSSSTPSLWRHTGALQTIVGVQEPLATAGAALSHGELVLIDGTVVAPPQDTTRREQSIGGLVLGGRTGHHNAMESGSPLIVQLANGEQVSVQGGEPQHLDTALSRVNLYPLPGDGVRVLARADVPRPPATATQGGPDAAEAVRLLPRVVQIMEPSPERSASIAEWQQQLDAGIASLGSQGAAHAAEELAHIIDDALYSRDAGQLGLGLSVAQKQELVAKMETLFASNPHQLPVAVALLKNSQQQGMDYALRITARGLPVLSMTATEFRDFVVNSVINRAEYTAAPGGLTDVYGVVQDVYCLFQVLHPGPAGTAVARNIWDKLTAMPIDEHDMIRRARALHLMTYGSNTLSTAALWHDIALSRRVPFEYIGPYLCDHIASLGREPNVTATTHDAFMVYEETLLRLDGQIDDMEEGQRDAAREAIAPAQTALMRVRGRLSAHTV